MSITVALVPLKFCARGKYPHLPLPDPSPCLPVQAWSDLLEAMPHPQVKALTVTAKRQSHLFL